MVGRYKQTLLVITAAVFVAACGATAPPTPALTTALPSPAAVPTATTPPPAAPPSPPPPAGPTGVPTAAAPTASSPAKIDSMKLQLRFADHDTVMRATLRDSATTRDFLALLPLTETFEDYAETEKIYYLPTRLSIADAAAGSDPAVGDIAYYAPWGNLAIFYRDAGYANGLVILGRIDGGLEALAVPGAVRVTIEADSAP